MQLTIPGPQVMCILWKQRQKRLEIDDFGHPLALHHTTENY
jgi:hypothetical protein